MWRDRFNRDPSALGRTLHTANDDYTIVGVMPASFSFPDRADLWFPLRLDPATTRRTDYFLRSVGRLRPGVPAAAATAELSGLLDQIHRENPGINNGWKIRATNFRDVAAGSYRRAVLTLLAAVGFLLLIACANVSNILLTKASTRGREMIVRRALGASRRRLVRQLVSESLLLGLAGGAAGVLLAIAGVPALLSLVPVDLPRWMDFSIDRRVLAFALAVSSLTSVLFGLVPSFGLSRRDVTPSLGDTGRGGTASARQKWLRHALVVAEVALSITLLAGAGVMTRSFVALRGQDLGYQPDHVLSFNLSYPRKSYPDGPKARALVQGLRDDIAALPGVTSLALATGLPLADGWTRLFTVEGRPQPLKDMGFVNHVVVTPGYFKTLGIPLILGRDFSEDDFQAGHLLVVTQAFASQHWPGESAIGKRIRFGPPSNEEPWHTIVGIAADNRHSEIKATGNPTVYLPYGAYDANITPSVVAVRASIDPTTLTAAIRERIAGRDRSIAMSSVATLEQIVARASWQDRFFTVLMSVFAAMALLLAAVGLYAVLSYTVSLHTREIGIRMALGASIGAVRLGVLRQGMMLAASGLAIGILAAVGFTRLLRTELFHVSPTDPVTYLAAPIVLMAVALAAALLPTRRATRVDPVVALRSE
jgi:putative ABC transport system permease protein